MSDKKIKILCVEDEIDIRSNIADILRDEGYEVFEAGNGYQGYESFIQEKPDLIISDIMMPELDGYGLLKLVRDTSGLKNKRSQSKCQRLFDQANRFRFINRKS